MPGLQAFNALVYELVVVNSGTAQTIVKRDGSTPQFLVGYVNLSSSNQAVTGTAADLNGNTASLPQIGDLGATQAIGFPDPGIALLNGLIVTLSGSPSSPGIGVLVR